MALPYIFKLNSNGYQKNINFKLLIFKKGMLERNDVLRIFLTFIVLNIFTLLRDVIKS